MLGTGEMMKPPTQIERPSPTVVICPVCKQPSHLGCDHAIVEFKADLREKQRQANRASREKAKEIKDRDNIAPVENTKESGNDIDPAEAAEKRKRVFAKEEMPTEEEADASEQTDLHDMGCRVWELMTPETRERFLADARPGVEHAKSDEPSQAQILTDLFLLWNAASETTRERFLAKIEPANKKH
jgi:hypothetical protein